MDLGIVNLNIQKSVFNVSNGDILKNGIILDVVDSISSNINGSKINNNILLKLDCYLMMFKKSGLLSDPFNTVIRDLEIKNPYFLPRENIVKTYILFEKIDIVILNFLTFSYLFASQILIISEISSISIENSSFTFINNKLNPESSTIITIKESPSIFIQNITCTNSYSFSSTTCFVLENLKASANVDLQNSIFSYNIAEYFTSGSTQGVALYSNIIKGNFMISNCKFSHNQLFLQSSAPCIFSASLEDNMNISKTLFLNNTSDLAEICLYHQGNLLSISDSSFERNVNKLMDGSSNAALSTSSFMIFLKNVSFLNNEASNAAAILVQNSVSKASTFVRIDQIFVSSNIAVYSSILFSSNIKTFDIIIENSQFFNNSGLIKGGVFQTWYALYGNMLVFSKCFFDNNRAYASGGAAYIANLGNEMIFESCIFSNNQALNDGGGAINMYGDPNTIVSSKNCRFLNNSSPKKGGFLLLTTGVYYDDGSQYFGNSAEEAGLIAINFFSILAMTGSSVNNSRASSAAGVLKLMGQSDVTLTNITFMKSFAPKGGVFVTGGLSVEYCL